MRTGRANSPTSTRKLAADIGARTVVDLGCGTGLLTRVLGGRGHAVIGIDPSPEMLAVARRGPHADQVRWISGNAPTSEPRSPTSRS